MYSSLYILIIEIYIYNLVLVSLMKKYLLEVNPDKWERFTNKIPRSVSINKQLNILIDIFIEENR